MVQQGTKMFSAPWNMTVLLPSRLVKLGPIHLGAWARSCLARSILMEPSSMPYCFM